MNLIDVFVQNGPLLWLMSGVLLLAAELVLPGLVFLLLGSAAIAVAAVTFLVPMSWPVQFILFAGLSAAAVAGRGVLARLAGAGDEAEAPPSADILIGLEGFLSEPIIAGNGRMEFDGVPWVVTGPDMPVGEHVRVVSLKAGALVVEATRADSVRAG